MEIQIINILKSLNFVQYLLEFQGYQFVYWKKIKLEKKISVFEFNLCHKKFSLGFFEFWEVKKEKEKERNKEIMVLEVSGTSKGILFFSKSDLKPLTAH